VQDGERGCDCESRVEQGGRDPGARQRAALQEAPVAEESVPECEWKQQNDEGILVERFGEPSVEKGGQRSGSTASRALQMQQEIDWAARVEGALGRRKLTQNESGCRRWDEWRKGAEDRSATRGEHRGQDGHRAIIASSHRRIVASGRHRASDNHRATAL